MGELDPLFTKALRLLHSRPRESVDQLAQLIEDVVAQKHGPQAQAMILAAIKVNPPGKSIAPAARTDERKKSNSSSSSSSSSEKRDKMKEFMKKKSSSASSSSMPSSPSHKVSSRPTSSGSSSSSSKTK